MGINCYTCTLPMDVSGDNEIIMQGQIRMVCDHCYGVFKEQGYTPLSLDDVKRLFIGAAEGYKQNREHAREKFLWHVAERTLYNMTHRGTSYCIVDIRFMLLEIAMRGERV